VALAATTQSRAAAAYTNPGQGRTVGIDLKVVVRETHEMDREREKSGNWKRRSSAHMASAVLLASRCSSSDRCGGRRPEGGDPASEECGRRTPPKQSKAKQLFLRFVTVKRSEGLKAKSAERQISRAWRVGYCV
jgi:hypothetical protein